MDLGAVSARIEIDDSKATKALESAQQALESLERMRPEVTVDADATQAEKKLGAVESFLTGVLDGMQAEVSVEGDTGRAEAAMKFVEGMLDGLEGEKSTVEVDADISGAEQGLDEVADKADAAGDDAGGRMGDGMVAGILAGLASIPIAGAVVKIGQAIGGALLDGIKDGLGQEVARDLFSARTGLDAATADKFARAAGQAYADAFGESVDENLQVARDALQKGLIDPDASSDAIQEIIGQLQTLGTIAEEETDAITTAVDRMLTTGIADSATEAFDVLIRGFQSGADASDDLLDTFTEYSGIFDALGLDATEAMGLIAQGMDAGARNADIVADALKEFQIRATDASETSAEAFESIGLNAEEMTAKIAAGGDGAKEGLDQVLDALRSIEDPVQRNLAGVALFGTMWEDMAGQVAQLDVSTAVSGLGEVEGALGRAMSALADNPATALETAKREIEVALDGIKGALAVAFSDPLERLADWASGNQAGVLKAFQGITNAMFDMAEGGVEAVATLIEATGQIPGALEPVLWHMASIATSWNTVAEMVPGMPEIPQSVINSLGAGATEAGNFEEKAGLAADGVRGLVGVLDEQRDNLNITLGVAINDAAISDVMGQLSGLMVAVDSATGTVSITADESQAAMTLGELVSAIDVESGTVTIDGQDYDARTVLAGLLGDVSSSAGIITIDGVDYDARTVLGILMGDIDASSGTVSVLADASAAYQTLDSFFATYNGRTLTTYQQIQVYGQGVAATGGSVDAIAAAVQGFDVGGAVYGPGGPTEDLVPAIGPGGVPFRLSNGEHVLTADDVLDLGGQQGAYMLRAMIQAGMVKPLEQSVGMAAGGGVGSTPAPAAPSVSFPRELTLVVDGRPMRAYIAEGVEASMVDMVRSAR